MKTTNVDPYVVALIELVRKDVGHRLVAQLEKNLILLEGEKELQEVYADGIQSAIDEIKMECGL